MKANFDQVLNDLEGKPIPKNRDNDPTPVTLKSACLIALTTPMQEDQQLTGEQSFKRLELARRINKGGEQELDPDEAVTIRNRAAKVLILEIAGQVYELLKG